MSLFHTNTLLGASGSGESGPLYAEDVFQTHLYRGSGSARTITNNIDLSGKGGLVWIKERTDTNYNVLTDTERGAQESLYSNENNAEDTATQALTAFTSSGFSVGTGGDVNGSNENFCSWTFRKAEGFFDIVTYTGNGTAGRTVAHNLGSTPGCIMIKCLSHAEAWVVFHRSLGATTALRLNLTQAKQDETFWFNDTAPTSSEFTLGASGAVNDPGRTYVAYLFAHDDQSFGENEDEAIIKCGSYSGNGSTYGTFQDLGFEPQWILVKPSSGVTDHWSILDNMRGVFTGAPSNGTDKPLHPSDNSSEQSDELIEFNATGFTPRGSDDKSNASSATYIYIAIRRPHKAPEAGTDVFNVTTTAINTNYTTDFVPDVAWIKSRSSGSYNWFHGTRLTGSAYLAHNSDNSEQNGGSWAWDNPTNTFKSTEVADDPLTYTFKRAPGFMDVVCYSGTGSNQNVSHGLTVAPEMMWVKRRNNNNYWAIYHSAQGNFRYHEGFKKDEKFEVDSSNEWWNSTTPTATQFTVGTESNVNASGSHYLAVLFATVAGVSKVGSYNGTGSALNVDCGFASGARLVIIKRANTVTSGSGNTDPSNWFVFNSTRGIVSGNDPFLLLNEQTQEFTNEDGIDPLNSGFTVVGGGKGLNVSGGQYIFLAIA